MSITDLLIKRSTDTSNILYSSQQYDKLVKAAITSSSISILSSFLIVIAFIYLRIASPDKADRISLRCVFMASVMVVIYSAFELGIILSYGDTVFCRTSGIIYIFCQILSAAFLALVGINLVLVFVMNVHYTAKQLERFYYPCAILYGLLTISVPISQMVDDPFSDEDYRCYYFVFYYRIFGNTGLYWMWYYGCLILSVVVATVCSITALVKLVREHHRLIDRFVRIASSSQTVDTANSNIQQRLKYQSNVFVKVVSRCIAYPLVPLISNIWGFIFQLIIIKPDVTPKFAFSMLDVVFKYLQGFFVALVFFSDPAMSHFLTERWSFCKEKYVENFSQVRQYSDGQIEIVQVKKDNKRTSNASLTLVPASVKDKPIAKPSPLRLANNTTSSRSSSTLTEVVYCHKVFRYRDEFTYIEKDPDYNITNITSPEIAYIRPETLKESSASNSSNEEMLPTTPTSTVVEPSCCPYQFISDPDTHRRILVPYKYPRVATAIHWILVKCGFKAKKLQEDTVHPIQFSPMSAQQDSQHVDSIESVNIHPTST